jgi:hypothetical protein
LLASSFSPHPLYPYLSPHLFSQACLQQDANSYPHQPIFSWCNTLTHPPLNDTYYKSATAGHPANAQQEISGAQQRQGVNILSIKSDGGRSAVQLTVTGDIKGNAAAF